MSANTETTGADRAMKTLDDYKDDVCEALGCDDRSDLHREHVSGCYDVEKLLEARDAEHRAELDAEHRTIEQLGKDAAAMAEKLDRAVTVLRECVAMMRIQEKRSSGEFHLSAEAFVPMWSSSLDAADKFLATPPPAAPPCTASVGSCNSPKACGEASKCIDARMREFVAPAESTPVLREQHGREDCPRPDHATAPSGDEAKVREIARAEAESIATRWVPAHMTARQGMVDDITASLVRYRQLGREDGAREERDAIDKLASGLAREKEKDDGFYSLASAACDEIADAIASRETVSK